MRRALVRYSYEDVLGMLDPLVAKWFRSRFSDLTEPQAYAIPLIAEGKNVLVSSPTGTGKTLTAFLWIISELVSMGRRGELEDRIYAVYVSPLRALANDIRRNLLQPLEEMKALDPDMPEVRVAVRTGDTPQSERAKMLRRPPHIFITTPESLSLALSAPKFRMAFRGVRWVIVDEIHEISSSKRGVMLSLNLERLQAQSPGIQRIGLSATQAPIEEIAKFLAGLQDGEFREVYVVEVRAGKELDLRVITPVSDLTEVPFEVASEKMYDILARLIKEARTTLVFTNTRSGTESVSYKLRQRGIENLEAHHGSLSKRIRLGVEEMLKKGMLKAVCTSTSLELGIDIGYIDLVVQIGSPKSVAKAIQRIGRSGHAYRSVARGVFIPLTVEDLQEVTVICRAAKEHRIDRIRIPENSLDVLAQVLTGMALERKWDAREAYRLVRNSYCFRNLPWEKFLSVLRYLSGKVYGEEVYGRIWFDEKDLVFGRKRSTRMLYFPNVGTIPDEADYQVITEDGRVIGFLSEAFVEKLRPGDIFVLGSRTYEFKRVRGSRVYVIDAQGRRPTVPSWVGEMLPRSFDLSIMIGEFREWLTRELDRDPIGALMEAFPIDEAGARSLVRHFREQLQVAGVVPSHRRVLVEGYIDSEGKYNIIFHFPFGRRVNDALSRAYAHVISNRYRTSVRITVTDDAFMLTTYRRVPLDEVVSLVRSSELEEVLREALMGTELFKQRFRHVATRGLMVLRRYRGREISVTSQQLRSDRLLRLLAALPDFPLIEETYNEILNIVMDLPNARKVLQWIEEGETEVAVRDYSETPSPFAYHIILAGVSDIVLISDKSALLRELHSKLLERVIGREELSRMYEFSEEEVSEYFRSKFEGIDASDHEQILDFLSRVGAAELTREKGFSLLSFTQTPRDVVMAVVTLLEREGMVVRARCRLGSHTTPENLRYLAPVFAVPVRDFSELHEAILRILREDGPHTLKELQARLAAERREIMAALRDLEAAFLVFRRRGGSGDLFVHLDVRGADRDEAVEKVLHWILYREGPMTLDELSARMGIPAEELEERLEEMLSRGILVKGRFTPSWDEQYLLAEDYEALRKRAKRGPSIEEVMSASVRNSLRVVEDEEEFFSRYVLATSPLSVAARARRFSLRRLVEMMLSDGIVILRTPNGRSFLVRRDYARMLAGIAPKTRLSELEELVLSKLEELGRSDPEELSILLGKGVQEVREALAALTEKMLVVRTAYGAYLPNRPLGEPGPVLKKICQAYGPLSDRDLEVLLGVPGLTGTVEDVRVTHVSGTPYYGPYPAPEGERTKFVPIGDVLSILRPGYASAGMTGFVDPTTGTAVEVELDEDAPRILGIEGPLEADEVVPEVFQILRKMGWRIVFLSRDLASSLGLEVEGDYTSYGEIDLEVGTRDILGWVVFRSGLDPRSRRENALRVLEELGAVRSDLELIARCWRPVRTEDILKSNLALQGYGLPRLISTVDPKFASKLAYLWSGRVSSAALEAARNPRKIKEEYLLYLMGKRLVFRDQNRKYVHVEPKRATYGEIVEKYLRVLGAGSPKRMARILSDLLWPEAIRAYLDELVENGKALLAVSGEGVWWLHRDYRPTEPGQTILHAHDPVFLLFEDEIKALHPRANIVVVDSSGFPLGVRVKKSGSVLKVEEISGDESYLDVIRSILTLGRYVLEEA